MNGIVLFAVAVLGVDYGWQPTVDGNLEYIIQIEPELLSALEEGTPITSEISLPPDAGRVTCFRVKVGNGQVPREAAVKQVGYQDGQPTAQNDPYGRPIARRPAAWTGDTNQYNQLANQNGYATPHQDMALPDRPHLGLGQGQTFGGAATSGATGGTMLNVPNDGHARTTETPSYRRFSDPTHDNYTTPTRRQVGFGDDPAADRYAALPSKSGTMLRAPTTENRVYGSYRTEAEKPWWPLFFTTTALFLSIGGNAYLAWMAAEFYSRYRDTIDRLRAVERRT